MNYSNWRKTEEICRASSKLITFIDLAGHPKYMKTTVFGLTGQHPDITMLVVSAACGAGKNVVLMIPNPINQWLNINRVCSI